jgi:Holliday junction DNA helicase RuvA
MIASLTGELHHVEQDRVHLRVGAMLFELLIPAVDAATLQAQLGEELTLHTILYLQGDSGGGGNIEPRLIGFLRAEDKKFFEKFITVKGIGPKTALLALTVSVGEIAQAIESKDARFLVGLDGIGKRTAELIIAELAGKVKDFATGYGTRAVIVAPQRWSEEEEVALAFATGPQMGLRRTDAELLLGRVKKIEPPVTAARDLLAEMLRLLAARV